MAVAALVPKHLRHAPGRRLLDALGVRLPAGALEDRDDDRVDGGEENEEEDSAVATGPFSLLASSFSGKCGELAPFWGVDGGAQGGAEVGVLVGMGHAARVRRSVLARSVQSAVRKLLEFRKAQELVLAVPVLPQWHTAELVEMLATEASLAQYKFDVYTAKEKMKRATVAQKKTISIQLYDPVSGELLSGESVPVRGGQVDADVQGKMDKAEEWVAAMELDTDVVERGMASHAAVMEEEESVSVERLEDVVQRGVAVAHATMLSRELVNDRADVVNAEMMGSVAHAIAQNHDVVLDEIVGCDALREHECHMLAAVGQAAEVAPRLVTLEYRGSPEGADAPVAALVGKGIVMDTGGLNLKRSMMESMHEDMAGAAAVLGTMKMVAALKLPVNVVGAVALAENAISSEAYRPGTILKSAAGSVQVNNTDAEGRLALGDAISHVQRRFKPAAVVDIATLTGAILYALGETHAGMWSNNKALCEQLTAAGLRCNEPVWQMPFAEVHRTAVQGPHSTLQNTGTGTKAGSATAASFLSMFVEDHTKTAWAHLDVAGTAMSQGKEPASGFGARLLFKWLEGMAQPPQ